MPKKRAVKDRQVAAIAYKREDDALHVLLTTSRETGRYVLPKGWTMKSVSNANAAAIETLEETGYVGTPRDRIFGMYRYWKRMRTHFRLVDVEVYCVEVTERSRDWKEKGQRAVSWHGPREAALLVDEPGLRTLLEEFASTRGG